MARDGKTRLFQHNWVWLLPLFAFVPVLMAPSGGYPSNPQFQSVSVTNSGVTAISTTTASTTDSSAIFNNTSANGPVISLVNGGTLIAYIGSATNTSGQGLVTDFSVRSGSRMSFWSNGHVTATPDFQIDNSSNVIVGQGKLQLLGNAQQPVVAFDASLLVSPTINTCLHCQASPTAVRNSVGNYTLQPQNVGSYIWSCTFRNNSAAPGTLSINSTTTGGLTLLIFNTGGSLADPSPNTVQCVGVS